jgi:serine/threonine protein kinase
VAANSIIAPNNPFDRRQLGKYEVLCRLSTGGMSAIYLAHQKGLAGFKKLVVLKTILPDIGGEEDFVGMFLEEARITAAFNHPNIAQVFELDTDDGQLFMAMEFVQGCTLVEMARACRQARENIPVGFTLASVRDTALALHYAHTFTDARGRRQIVIHRDVAEKNIMVTYEGVTKLLDFGIAKALGRSGRTTIGMVKGTSGYMSPEQIRGEPLDPRSDIFSLGVVLHECLTGLRLFHGKTAEEGMMAALREDVQPPSRWNKEVTPELDAVVLKALQRDREQRFSTALEFARAIEKAAPGALWHPEQSGEVVTRFFADRRAETRRLLESAEFGSDTTGEVRVQNVLARARGAGAAPSAPEPVKPVEAPRKPSLLTAPKVSMPNEDDGETRKADMSSRPDLGPAHATPLPLTSNKPETATSPARPKVIRAASAPEPAKPPSSGITGVNTAPDAAVQEVDDEDLGEKTIPAASLPDEIKNLRAQFAARRQAGAQAGPPGAGEQTAVLPPKPSVPAPAQPAPAVRAPPPPQPEAPTGPNLPDAQTLLGRDRISTDKGVDPVRILAGGRTSTGETLSITGQNEAMSWEDDDGVRTAIAAPGEVQEAIRRIHRQSRANMKAAHDDDEAPPDGRSRTLLLVIALVVLAALAVLGVLVLLDVIPLPGVAAPLPVGPETSSG